jgi:hypothetical protein
MPSAGVAQGVDAFVTMSAFFAHRLTSPGLFVKIEASSLSFAGFIMAVR